MEYEIKISKDGSKVTTEIIDAGEHNCKETAKRISHVFGKVSKISDKDDEQPVRQSGHIKIK